MTDTTVAPRFVGRSIERKEDARFLTGKGRYVDDHVLPGMLHAHVLRSPLARARIAGIETDEAAALPGVHAIYLAADINPRTTPAEYIFGESPSANPETLPLAENDVRYVGEPVALIVADDRYIAEDAAELIFVDYEPEDPVVTVEQAASGPLVNPDLSSNLAFGFDSPEDPELDKAFADAAHVVRHRVVQGRAAVTPMETRAIIASRSMPDQLDIWLTSQNPHQARSYLSRRLGLGENRIRVISPDVGGGFGQKFFVHRDEIAVCVAALLLGRPIKWVEDRAEALIAGGHSRTEALEMELAIDANATITAARYSWEDTCGAFALTPPEGSAMLGSMFCTGPYRIPRVGVSVKAWFTNTANNVAYRGPWAGETLIREATMDVAARQIGMDPVDFRLHNMIRAEDQPYTLASQIPVDGISPVETTQQAAAMVDIPAFRALQEKARKEGRHLGLGTSAYVEPCAISGGINASDVANIRIEQSGKVAAVITGHSQGHSIETTMAQIIADELGVDVDDVTVSFGDTAAIGFGAGAGGSRQAIVSGGASKVAAGKVRDKALAIAAHLLQTTPEKLRLEGGQAISDDATPRSVSLREIAATAYLNPAALPLDMEAGLEAQYRYAAPMFSFSNATHFCVAEVDTHTGMIAVRRWVVSEDCGVMLNPSVVEGQVAGGVAQAIGGVLWEEMPYDAYGNPEGGTLKDYLLPLATDMPIIEFGHIVTPSPTPTGAKGVGEGGAIVGAPAIYNAVMDALAPFGVTIAQLPLTPARVLAAISGESA